MDQHLARYADGRAALTSETRVTLGASALTFEAGGAAHEWPYASLRRADDRNGAIVLKLTADTGERLTLDAAAAQVLRAAAPKLFRTRAFGQEGLGLVAGLAVVAWSLAGAFLIGVPMAADPIAHAMPEAYKDRIAAIAWSQVEAFSHECYVEEGNAAGYDALDHLLGRLVDHADARADATWLRVVSAPFPNAFAMPDDSIVLTDQMIALAEAPDEIAGVLGHELAHIEQGHVMANVVRQVGAGVFFDVVFGGAGAGQVIAIASVNLAGLTYSREDEAEADARALAMMEGAGFNPGAVADLFDRLADEHPDDSSTPTFLRSHPATAERAETARARAAPGRAPALDAAEWAAVKAMCGMGADDEAPIAEEKLDRWLQEAKDASVAPAPGGAPEK